MTAVEIGVGSEQGIRTIDGVPFLIRLQVIIIKFVLKSLVLDDCRL